MTLPPTDPIDGSGDPPGAGTAPGDGNQRPAQQPRPEARAATGYAAAVIGAVAGVVEAVIAAVAFATQSIVGVFIAAAVCVAAGVGIGVVAWRARTGQPQSTTAQQWSARAAAVALVLAMIGAAIGGGAATYRAVSGPAGTPTPTEPILLRSASASGSAPTSSSTLPSRSASPRASNGSSPAPAGGVVQSGSWTRVVLKLSTDRPPRAGWSAAEGRPAVPGDVAIECRKGPPDIWESCVYGSPAQYRLIRSNGGRVAAVTAVPIEDRSVCAGAPFQDSDYLPIDQGQHYCVETPAHLIALSVESLPPASSDIEVTLLVTVWSR